MLYNAIRIRNCVKCATHVIRRVKCHTDRTGGDKLTTLFSSTFFSQIDRHSQKFVWSRIKSNIFQQRIYSSLTIRRSIGGFYLISLPIRNWDKALSLFRNEKISISNLTVWHASNVCAKRIHLSSTTLEREITRHFSIGNIAILPNRSRQIEYHTHNWTFRLGSKHSLNGSPAIP